MKNPTNPGALTGVKEIAVALGVSKQRAEQIANADSFPAPYDDLGHSRGRIWLTSTVAADLERLREERGLTSSTRAA